MLDETNASGTFNVVCYVVPLFVMVALWFYGDSFGAYFTSFPEYKITIWTVLCFSAFFLSSMVAPAFIGKSLYALAAAGLYAFSAGACLGVAVHQVERYKPQRKIPFAANMLFVFTLLIAGVQLGLLLSAVVQLSDLGQATTIRQRLPLMICTMQLLILFGHSLLVLGLWLEVHRPEAQAMPKS